MREQQQNRLALVAATMTTTGMMKNDDELVLKRLSDVNVDELKKRQFLPSTMSNHRV